MKARLLHPSRDVDWQAPLQAAAEREARRGKRPYRGPEFDRQAGLPWNEKALTADLELGTLLDAMASEDDCIFEVCRRAVFGSLTSDVETIRYRQAVLRDCLDHPAVVRELYAIAVEATEKQKRHYLGATLARYPDSVLRYASELMAEFLGSLRRLRGIADRHAQAFVSEGWSAFFAALKSDLDDRFFARAREHLEQLQFRNGVLLSARLGEASKGSNYVLRQMPAEPRNWWRLWHERVDPLVRRLTGGDDTTLPGRTPRRASPVYSFWLHPRDESGAHALAELRNRGMAQVADALAQSADHVRDFFSMLQAELAFYVGCINLHQRLTRKGERVCMPVPVPAEERRMSFRGLRDPCLALRVDHPVVGNDANADGKDLIIVTGANQGGKSTFLRSLGLAQLMMQSGMFVAADDFRASLCAGLFTHFKREEDPGMKSGKLDEELGRMSEIVDHLNPRSLILFNEPFAATNEREGAEIGRQIMTALLERSVRIACVTHLYELANGFYVGNAEKALFLRAERERTFKLRVGEPLPTSFGEDLYETIFEPDAEPPPIARAEELSAAGK